MISKKLIAAGVFVLLTAAFLTQALRPKPLNAPAPARGLAAGPKTPASTRAQVSNSFGKLPLSFEANAGQSHAGVNFLSRGKGYTLYLSPTEAVLGLHKQASARRRPHRAAAPQITGA